jgi:hypothetical protein
LNSDDDRSPQEWREILRTGLTPPEATGGLLARRRARRAHRRAARRATRQWVAEERRREPLRPAGALAVVVLLLALGAGARWVWPSLAGPEAPAKASASPSAERGGQSPGHESRTSSFSPSPKASAAVDRGDSDQVAAEAIRRYLTRNPPVDGDHKAAVKRAAPYLTDTLAENLQQHPDPEFDRLVSRGGVAVVSRAKVRPAGKDLPGDTPIRVWRTVAATVKVAGYTRYSETTTLQVEVIEGRRGWRVSRILGLETG